MSIIEIWQFFVQYGVMLLTAISLIVVVGVLVFVRGMKKELSRKLSELSEKILQPQASESHVNDTIRNEIHFYHHLDVVDRAASSTSKKNAEIKELPESGKDEVNDNAIPKIEENPSEPAKDESIDKEETPPIIQRIEKRAKEIEKRKVRK